MRPISENHQREQYFWDQETIVELADFLEPFENPCCLCTPSVGEELERRHKSVTILEKAFLIFQSVQFWQIQPLMQ